MTPIRAVSLFLLLSCAASGFAEEGIGWRNVLAHRIRVFGHRNWIVIADSAYPAQSRDGIETLDTEEDFFTVLKYALDVLKDSKHVTPVLYTDTELKYVDENDAPGVADYRTTLSQKLDARPTNTVPHDQIIAKLDTAGQTFRILILKTNLRIPYTSVFINLNCGYWNDAAEKRLRDKMK